MILDTSFIIDFLRGEIAATNKMQELEKKDEPQFITAPTVHELWSGITQMHYAAEKQQEKIEEVLLGIPILPLNRESAERSGKIDGTLTKEGKKIAPEDCMIAGIALHHRQPVLTNDAHFALIDGLRVERY